MQYLILFSPVPFFLLLALSKSKISWYFTTIIPLFALTIPYVFLRIKNKWMQNVLGFIVITMFVIRFIPQTYALKVTSDNRNDRIRVGLHKTLLMRKTLQKPKRKSTTCKI
jgi:uncharacterized membrane protein